MKPDLQDFRDAAENAGRWYGLYRGRAFHEGFAVELDDAADLVTLGIELERAGLDLGKPHVDSLGSGVIASFARHRFNPASITDDVVGAA
jgi:hypothetical protein